MSVKQTHLSPWNYSMSISHLCQAQSSLWSATDMVLRHAGGGFISLRAAQGRGCRCCPHSSAPQPQVPPVGSQFPAPAGSGQPGGVWHSRLAPCWSALLLGAHCQQPSSGSRKQPGTVCSELELSWCTALNWRGLCTEAARLLGCLQPQQLRNSTWWVPNIKF